MFVYVLYYEFKRLRWWWGVGSGVTFNGIGSSLPVEDFTEDSDMATYDFGNWMHRKVNEPHFVAPNGNFGNYLGCTVQSDGKCKSPSGGLSGQKYRFSNLFNTRYQSSFRKREVEGTSQRRIACDPNRESNCIEGRCIRYSTSNPNICSTRLYYQLVDYLDEHGNPVPKYESDLPNYNFVGAKYSGNVYGVGYNIGPNQESHSILENIKTVDGQVTIQFDPRASITDTNSRLSATWSGDVADYLQDISTTDKGSIHIDNYFRQNGDGTETWMPQFDTVSIESSKTGPNNRIETEINGNFYDNGRTFSGTVGGEKYDEENERNNYFQGVFETAR